MRISEYDDLGPGAGLIIEHDLEEPIKISPAEKELLQDKLRSNYRNIQELNDRDVYRIED